MADNLIRCPVCGEAGPCRSPETRQFVKRHVPAQPEPASAVTPVQPAPLPDPGRRSRWRKLRRNRAA